MSEQEPNLFEREQEYPDLDAKARYDALVGIDAVKARVTRMLSILVNPESLSAWAKKHHPKAAENIVSMMSRPPLVVFEGEVGSGKSALAESVGDPVARANGGLPVYLLPISLASRGQGRVGEMTLLLTQAFEEVIARGKKLRRSGGKPSGALILLVDEADALAQSREASQMHHEDKAGVNAFIRGLDRIANEKVPVAVIMCTNRLGALDPAVRRRAVDVFTFERPNTAQRADVLTEPLRSLGVDSGDITTIVSVTGPRKQGALGFTYSDLRQRLIPAIILDAFPDRGVDSDRAVEIAKEMIPAPSFKEQH